MTAESWIGIGLGFVVLIASLHAASKELNQVPKPPKQHLNHAWLFCIYCTAGLPGLLLMQNTDYIFLEMLGALAFAAGVLSVLTVPFHCFISLLGYGTTQNKQYLKILVPIPIHLTLFGLGCVLFWLI